MDEPQTDKPDSTNPEEIEVPLSDGDVRDPELEVYATKKNKDDKGRKKDDKSVEQVLKALSSLRTSEEKLAAMCKKYADIVDENRKMQVHVKQYEKKVLALQREKEQIQAEQSKAVLTRSRLESLCRELQKQNKQIKEESLQRIKEEEEKRKAVSAKFQTTLSEITMLMQQNNENNAKLREENLEMQSKFKTVCEQYELREQQVEKMSKQMQLESQLAEAKLTKLKIEMVTEKEVLENEKRLLLMELAAYQQKCQEWQKTEAVLNSQISVYTEKYDKFQNALAKSNQLYGGFKEEMGKMSKKIAKLEKETSVWKMRWENNHKALLQVAAEKQAKVSELSLASRQLTQLQKLCRTLQADRSTLLMQLKSEGIEPKLSGEAVSEEVANDSDSRPPENLNSNLESAVTENGKSCEIHDVNSNSSPDVEEAERDNGAIPSLDVEEPTKEPEMSEVAVENQNVTDSRHEKGNEIVASEPNLKTKKGKVNIVKDSGQATV